jgi:hypothetical protein
MRTVEVGAGKPVWGLMKSSRVTVKAPYGAAPRGRVIHRPGSAVAFFSDGKARYAVTWLCRSSADAVFLAEPDGRPLCERCADLFDPPVVYRCFTATRVLLYIGATDGWRSRLKEHQRKSSWWPEVDDITFERYPTVAEAFAAETLAIRAERPLHNKQVAVAAEQGCAA